MKDVLELRPVWHRTEERVRAHVLVAALALALDRVLERKLHLAGLDLLSSRAAWDALEAVSLVEFECAGWPAQGGGVRERRGRQRGVPSAAGAGSEAGSAASAGRR